MAMARVNFSWPHSTLGTFQADHEEEVAKTAASRQLQQLHFLWPRVMLVLRSFTPSFSPFSSVASVAPTRRHLEI